MQFVDCSNMENYSKTKTSPLEYQCIGAQKNTGKGWLDKALTFYEGHKDTVDTLAQSGVKLVKDKYGKNPGDAGYIPTPEPTSDTILGMPKPLAYGLGIVLLAGISYGIYVAVKK